MKGGLKWCTNLIIKNLSLITLLKGLGYHRSGGYGFFGNLSEEDIRNLEELIKQGEELIEIYNIPGSIKEIKKGIQTFRLKLFILKSHPEKMPPIFIYERVNKDTLELYFSPLAYERFDKLFRTSEEQEWAYRVIAYHGIEEDRLRREGESPEKVHKDAQKNTESQFFKHDPLMIKNKLIRLALPNDVLEAIKIILKTDNLGENNNKEIIITYEEIISLVFISGKKLTQEEKEDIKEVIEKVISLYLEDKNVVVVALDSLLSEAYQRLTEYLEFYLKSLEERLREKTIRSQNELVDELLKMLGIRDPKLLSSTQRKRFEDLVKEEFDEIKLIGAARIRATREDIRKSRWYFDEVKKILYLSIRGKIYRITVVEIGSRLSGLEKDNLREVLE
ncbi:MAG: hypothetical protein N2Z79_00040, partial [Candidatus Omnitrophica bacterium]|nr:hypothetical protein [Candidatus Omnitrophota bacterium]